MLQEVFFDSASSCSSIYKSTMVTLPTGSFWLYASDTALHRIYTDDKYGLSSDRISLFGAMAGKIIGIFAFDRFLYITCMFSDVSANETRDYVVLVYDIADAVQNNGLQLTFVDQLSIGFHPLDFCVFNLNCDLPADYGCGKIAKAFAVISSAGDVPDLHVYEIDMDTGVLVRSESRDAAKTHLEQELQFKSANSAALRLVSGGTFSGPSFIAVGFITGSLNWGCVGGSSQPMPTISKSSRQQLAMGIPLSQTLSSSSLPTILEEEGSSESEGDERECASYNCGKISRMLDDAVCALCLYHPSSISREAPAYIAVGLASGSSAVIPLNSAIDEFSSRLVLTTGGHNHGAAQALVMGDLRDCGVNDIVSFFFFDTFYILSFIVFFAIYGMIGNCIRGWNNKCILSCPLRKL